MQKELTVQQLIDLLSGYDPTLPVFVIADELYGVRSVLDVKPMLDCDSDSMQPTAVELTVEWPQDHMTVK